MTNKSKMSLATTYDIINDFDAEKFIKVRLKICHDGVNLNNSRLSIDVINEAAESLKNSPILANVLFDEDDVPQFGSHDMSIEKNKIDKENYKMIYKEIPIGVIPENNNYTVICENDKQYACCDGYIWRSYSNYAEDIVQRDVDVNISMEIIVDSWNLNTEDNVYDILAYRYTGVTLLGNDVQPAMEGATASMVFEVMDNDKLKERMLIIMQELKDTLASYNNINQEGGCEMNNEEIIETSVEETVEIPETSTEESVVEETTTEFSTEETVVEETTEEVAPVVESVVTTEATSDIFVKSFSYKSDSIISRLYAALENNNVDAYINNVCDEYFTYVNSCNYFKTFYSITENEVELGETFACAKIVTEEELNSIEAEKAEFESLKSEYESLKAEVGTLRAYKSQIEANEITAKKNEILEHWSAHLNGVEAFAELKSKIDEYSVEEIEIQCKCIYADNAVKFATNFSAKKSNKSDVISVDLSVSNEEPSDVYHGLVKAFN